MPRGAKLNDNEKGQIEALKSFGLSNRDIARRLGRSPGLIDNYIKKGKKYGKKKSPGRPQKLNERTKRRIFEDLSNTTKGTRTARNELAPNVSHVTVWRAVQSSPNLVRERMRRCPHLNQVHKAARIAFAEQRIWWTKKWKMVKMAHLPKCIKGILLGDFLGRKEVESDGPDGFTHYWRDLRREPSFWETWLRRRIGHDLGSNLRFWASDADFRGRKDGQSMLPNDARTSPSSISAAISSIALDIPAGQRADPRECQYQTMARRQKH